MREKKMEARRNKKKVIGKIFLFLFLIILIAGTFCLKKMWPTYTEAKAKCYESLTNINDASFVHKGNTVVYWKNKNVIGKLGNEKFDYVPIDDISKYVTDGYISAEDKSFPMHHGVDYKALARAGLTLIKNRMHITQGGSTITMQVVKNNLLTQKRTYNRKLAEIMLAGEIEKKFNKAEIMEIYCNTNYYAENCYGIGAASKYYFNCKAKDLSLAQSAMLVGISNAPTRYNPVINYDNSIAKMKRVLKYMLDNKKITQQQYDKAIQERPKLYLKTKKRSADNYMLNYALHCAAIQNMKKDGFKFKYVFNSKKEYETYKKKYNDKYSMMMQDIRSGGYKIYTSIDYKAQHQLQAAVSDNLRNFRSKNCDGIYDMQGAAVSIDNKTGLVVAIVGGREKNGSYNRGFLAKRQPGSCIKPLLDYGPAINEGKVEPATIINDAPVKVHGYSPKNSGGGYRGKVKVREALARSLNTVAFQLFNDVGSKKALSYLSKLEFSSISFADRYNSAISVGGFTNGVSVVDMARGYAAIENGGRMRTSDCIIKITDSKNTTLYKYKKKAKGKKIFSEETAYMLTDMLQGPIRENYGTAARAKNKLSGQYYAGKTGTTNDSKDAWFCGFSPYYTTAIWVGYDNPKPVRGMYGSTYPLDIFTQYMNQAHKGLKKIPYKVPSTILLKKNGQTRKFNPKSNDLYKARPAGWDFSSITLFKKVETNTKNREDKIALLNAKKAVKEYECSIIASTEMAMDIDNQYYKVLEIVGKVDDNETRAKLTERVTVHYTDLQNVVKENWKDLIEAKKKDDAIAMKEEADRKLQEESEKATRTAKEVRISRVRSLINDLNNSTEYTNATPSLIQSLQQAISYCSIYDEYNSLKKESDKAIAHATKLPRISDDEKRY